MSGWTLAELDAILPPDPHKKRAARAWATAAAEPPRGDFPPEIAAILADPADAKIDRSARLFELCCACRRARYTDGQIAGTVKLHKPSRAKYGDRLEEEVDRILSKLGHAGEAGEEDEPPGPEEPTWDGAEEPSWDEASPEADEGAELDNDGAQARRLPPPGTPVPVARRLLAERYSVGGLPVLCHWGGTWWHWETTHWAPLEAHVVREAAYSFTEHATYVDTSKKAPESRWWAPNRHRIADLLEALSAVCLLAEPVTQPGWTVRGDWPAGPIVSCRNGLLDLATRTLYAHDPRYFNLTAVDIDYDPEAPPPLRWLTFLSAIWGTDTEQVMALQEWMGYVVSDRVDLDTILLPIGPTRAGKGVICRVMEGLVGADNVAAPSLASLGSDFGLAPLLGKPLAVIADARLNGRRDTSTIIERLLSISGRDRVTVNRKYQAQWTGTLPTRFVVCSNELPHLGDASYAIVGRLLVLQLEQSWLGKEDRGLEAALRRELSGILNWALAGLDRLTSQGRFTRPKTSEEAIEVLKDLASPAAAFVRDCCERGKDERGEPREVGCDQLWQTWKYWADDNGHARGSKASFGQHLRAVVPGIRVGQPRDGDKRHRVYRGLGLKEPAPTGNTDGGGP